MLEVCSEASDPRIVVGWFRVAIASFEKRRGSLLIQGR